MNRKEKEIKVIEAFAGYGSQRMALENIGYTLSQDSGIIEWTADAIVAYASVHHSEKLEKYFNNLNTHGYSKEHLIKYLLENYTLSSEKKKVNGEYVPLDESQYKRWTYNKLLRLISACKASNNHGSIMDTKGDILNDIDLFTYSFPCQDLSLAGKMRGITETSRSGLLYQVERMLREQDADKRPKVLLMENVKNLVGKKFMPDFQKWVEVLFELGYNTQWKVLNAKEHGIPQNRERVFAISIRMDEEMRMEQEDWNIIDIENIEKKPLDLRLKDFLEKEVDESYYLSDKHIQKITYNKNYSIDEKKPQIIGNVSPSGHGQGGNVYSSNGIAPTFTENHGNVMKVVEKQKYITINKDGVDRQGDRCFKENAVIGTLVAGSPYKVLEEQNKDSIIPLRIRKITPKEALRLMGVDDERIEKMTKYVTTKSAQYKLAGNSIVVQVLEDIFREINL